MIACTSNALHADEPAKASGHPWRVLLLLGGDLSLPAVQAHDHSFRTTLQALAPGPVTFFVESIDTQRFSPRNFEAESVALLSKKYAGQPVDLVVASGAGIVDFVDRYHHRIWPAAPVIFSTINSALIDSQSPLHAYPYLAWKLDVQGTLDMIHALQPSATRLAVVGGTGPFDQSQVDAVMAVARQQSRWTSEAWNTYTLAELTAKLSSADANTAVIYTTMFQDASGLPVFPVDALEKIAAKSGAPVYGMYKTYAGRGMAAGRVVDYQELGQRAADIAADILRGKTAPLAERQLTIGSHCIADYPPMAAHGLSLSALPAQCEVTNLPRNLWTQYRWFVLGVVIVITSQGFTIAVLLQQRRRLIAAEQMGNRQRIELARAMRFAAMGELTASIAHEINQPLGAILSNAQAGEILLAKDAATPDQLRSILSDIRRDNERAHSVIKKLRALLSKHDIERQPIHLHQAIDDVLSIVQPEARRRGISLDLNLTATNDLLSGDSVQLQQVIINLALNAMDALDCVAVERRRLTLRTVNTQHRVCLEVIDTGCGIEDAMSNTIFDSFCTTKTDGLGLGLPIVRAIVQAHDGAISFVSRPGSGSTFTVTLPVYEIPA